MRLRLLRRALICGAITFLGLLAVPATPASADVCVQAGVGTDGSDPPYQGFSDPIQPWPFTAIRCVEHQTWVGPYTAKLNVCVPTVV